MTEQPPPPESPQSPQSPEPPAQPQTSAQPQAYAGAPPPIASAGSNGMAIAALIMGVLTIIFFFLFFPLAIILGILGIIFGFIGRGRARDNPAAGGGGMALAGIITSIIGLLLSLIVSVVIGLLLGAAVSSSDELYELERQLEGIQQP